MPPNSSQNASFSAADVRRTTGLTSRQLNDWDKRGALPHARDGDQGWRRFTLREIFVLMVIKEMRNRFGVPVERLKQVKDWMLQDEVDHLEAAVELIAALGVDVWILTDCETTFVMASDLEMETIFSVGNAGAWGDGFVLLKVNPIVNKLLGTLDEPIELTNHGTGFAVRAQWRADSVTQTPLEHQVLRLLREGLYDSIEITLRNGKATLIRKSKRLDAATTIGDLIRSNDYQQIKINVQDGQVVMLDQIVAEKP